jgi:hypothetical protein
MRGMLKSVALRPTPAESTPGGVEESPREPDPSPEGRSSAGRGTRGGTRSCALCFRATARHASASGSVCPVSGVSTALIVRGRGCQLMAVSAGIERGGDRVDRDVCPMKCRYYGGICQCAYPPGKRVYPGSTVSGTPRVGVCQFVCQFRVAGPVSRVESFVRRRRREKGHIGGASGWQARWCLYRAATRIGRFGALAGTERVLSAVRS